MVVQVTEHESCMFEVLSRIPYLCTCAITQATCDITPAPLVVPQLEWPSQTALCLGHRSKNLKIRPPKKGWSPHHKGKLHGVLLFSCLWTFPLHPAPDTWTDGRQRARKEPVFLDFLENQITQTSGLFFKKFGILMM